MKINTSKLRSNALIMIYLVLSLSFFATPAIATRSSEFAGIIKSIQVYDSLEIHQVARLNSQVITVTVRIKSDDVQPEDVTVNGQVFESCDVEGEFSLCTAVVSVSLNEGETPIIVRYGTATQLVPLVVDNTAPEITSFVVNSQYVSAGQQASATLQVKDSADNTDKCSGIRTIEISKDSLFTQLVAVQNFESLSVTDCSKSQIVFFNMTGQTSQVTLYARATDQALNVMNGYVQSQQVTYDGSVPVIVQANFIYRGQRVVSLPVGVHQIQFEALIQEDTDLVSASLQLTGYTQGIQQGSCVKEGSQYRCIWTGSVTINEDTVLSGSLQAKDAGGNVGQQSLSISVGIDASGPIIDIQVGEHDVLGSNISNNVIVAAITDEDSEVDFGSVVADLSLIGAGQSVRPTKCIENVCSWQNLVVSAGNRFAEIKVSASDVFGHSRVESKLIFIDTVGPKITSVTQNDPAPSAERPLVFDVNFVEDQDISSAIADVHRISDQGTVEGECKAVNGTKKNVCTFEVSVRNEVLLEPVTFILQDLAGNSGTFSKNIQVFRTEAEISPNVVSVSVGGSKPPKIDRRVASSIPLKVYVPLTIRVPSGTLISEKLLHCEGGTEFLYEGEGNNPYLLAKDTLNPHMVITLLLDSTSSLLDKVSFDCELSMLVRSGGVAYKKPEIEKFKVNLELYNVAVGEIDQAVLDKLEDIKDSIDQGWVSLAETLDQILFYIRKICNIMQIVQRVYGIIETVKPLVYTIASLLGTSGGNGIWQGFLSLECWVKEIKDVLWPSDTDFIYSWDKAGIEALAGGVARNEAAAPASGFASIGGIARRVCAFATCAQCNQGFGLTGVIDGLNDKIASGIGLSSVPPIEGESKEAFQERISKNDTLNLDNLVNVNVGVHMNPFDSWAVAVGCLCIPGIVHNALKYRDLQCIHARCISDNARYGFSTAECDAEHQVRTCVFWGGALFHLIPGYLLFKTMMTQIIAFVRELPARLILAAKDKACAPFQVGKNVYVCILANQKNTVFPASPMGPWSIACGAADLAMLIYSWNHIFGNAMDGFSGLFDFDYDRDKICDGAFAALDDYQNSTKVDASAVEGTTANAGEKDIANSGETSPQFKI